MIEKERLNTFHVILTQTILIFALLNQIALMMG